MESIKERARSYALNKTGYSPFYKEHEAAYVEIAKEQKAQDIDRACAWLRSYIKTFTETPSMLEDFRKAMEE